MRSSNVMRALAACGLALGSLGAVCNPISIYVCASDDDCQEHGRGGRCEPNLACSFEDDECPEGRRWHSRADDEPGECLGVGLAGTDGSWGDGGQGDSSSSSPQAAEGGETSVDDAEGSSGLPQNTSTSTSTSSTSLGEGTSGTSTSQGTTTSSETGATQSCDEQYGSVLDYQRCTETPDTCAFNVRVDMSATCAQVCSMFGGECVVADLNDTEPCVSIGQIACDDMSFMDAICTCSRE